MPNSEAIAWYVEESQRLLEEQQRRAESLQTRAGQIAGFGAVLLALIGRNAATILHELHGVARPRSR
jgi:protein subunit release factor B